jgi:NADH dehydrogenase FAD-containing subunit
MGHLVFVGAGHAHLTPLSRIADYLAGGHRVTVINPFSYTYYSGMGPGLLAGLYHPRQTRFNVKKMTEGRGAAFIEDSVSTIDVRNRRLLLKGGQSVPYDIVSFNSGSEVHVDPHWCLGNRVIAVKPVLNLFKARCAILSDHGGMRFVVAGGGAAGVEVCANLWRLLHDCRRPAQIVLVAGERILEGWPAGARLRAMNSLVERGIRVVENRSVESVTEDCLTLSDQETLPFDYAFMALGVRPSDIFGRSGLRVSKDGGLPVNGFLQSIDHPELFGGGDCISLEGAKLARVGVHAVRQAPILHHNLLAALHSGEMKRYAPQEDYMLILNMGDGKGILFKRGLTWSGRVPFWLKDFIDKRFVRKFQICGELDESN